MSADTHVIVIGAGMGGLLLAQALKRAGILVSVYERESSKDARFQGYRFALQDMGFEAVRDCVSEDRFKDFEKILDTQQTSASILLVNHETCEPYWDFTDLPQEPNARVLPRNLLRDFLIHEMEDNVHYSKIFESYEGFDDPSTNTRRVKVNFADGTQVIGDVLVGCDGANSHVRGAMGLQNRPRTGVASLQLMSKPTAEDFNTFSPDVRSRIIAMCLPCGLMGFSSPYYPAKEVNGVRKFRVPGCPEPDEVDWDAANHFVLIAGAEDKLAAKLGVDDMYSKSVTGPLIKETLLRVFREEGVSANLTAIAARALEQNANPIRFNSCTRAPEGWSAAEGDVPAILIGDAMHAMLPTRGMGGNLAMLDAKDLTHALVEWRDAGAREPLPELLRRLEGRIAERGAQWIGSSVFWARQYMTGGHIFDKYRIEDLKCREEMEGDLRFGFYDNASVTAVTNITNWWVK